ncbi:hypothetical protein E4T56_gene20488 [Termitomyces sp. T112]|nr:hypothetical protein E4T56_gene20488 [Termitomyces sp. T112]
MDFSESASSEDAPELNGGMEVATATDNKGPSSVRAALTEGATDEGSSAGWCKRRVASALINLEEHAKVLPVISGGDIPLIIPQEGRGYPNGLE